MSFVDKVQRVQESASAAEWYVMAWVTRLVMIAAILANWKKATDTLQVMSKPGSGWQVWDPFALALALEGAFAIAAYFLSMQVQGRGGSRGRGSGLQIVVLAISVPVLGFLSGVANVDYFLRYSDAGSVWGQWRAILMGSAAPIIAVLTAVLAGTVSGIAMEAAGEQRDVEAEARAHNLAMARQVTAQARAAAREAKAGVREAISGTVPARAEGGNGNRKWTPESLLAEYPEATGWTGSRIAEIAGIGERQGRNWKRRMLEGRGEDV